MEKNCTNCDLCHGMAWNNYDSCVANTKYRRNHRACSDDGYSSFTLRRDKRNCGNCSGLQRGCVGEIDPFGCNGWTPKDEEGEKPRCTTCVWAELEATDNPCNLCDDIHSHHRLSKKFKIKKEKEKVKYKQTEKLTVGNILKALEKETCYEAKAHFTDWVIWAMREGYTKIHLYHEEDLSPESFNWLLKSSKRVVWLLEKGFIEEVTGPLRVESMGAVYYKIDKSQCRTHCAHSSCKIGSAACRECVSHVFQDKVKQFVICHKYAGENK